jgi:hypothetical protein
MPYLDYASVALSCEQVINLLENLLTNEKGISPVVLHM